ncbi:MAG: LytTR family transcriptional regulator DNA-binding domain-containing protein [Bacteroidaceae bacterium]|nr:LytTR family transcriptional regulator DNA-binding domain-containing protein [Bacteroidaceae bacterium]
MDLKKKAPRFLLESRTLAKSVIAIVLFSILFMVIYGPYSPTSWLTLRPTQSENTGLLSAFHAVMASVTFFFVAIAFLILSKVILYYMGRKYQLINAHLIAWIGGEVVLISFIYTVFTALFELADPNMFLPIWGRSIMVLSIIIFVPYIICLQDATNRHQQQLLDRLGMNVVNDKTEDTDMKLIHLVDSTGRLRMSINIDSLYYIESQDNYVKIYYDSDGKLCNYMLRSTTKSMETKFGDWLIRCHRGYLVNKNKIRIFRNDRDGMYIRLMHDGIRQIPVSKSYASNIQRILSQHTEEKDA